MARTKVASKVFTLTVPKEYKKRSLVMLKTQPEDASESRKRRLDEMERSLKLVDIAPNASKPNGESTDVSREEKPEDGTNSEYVHINGFTFNKDLLNPPAK